MIFVRAGGALIFPESAKLLRGGAEPSQVRCPPLKIRVCLEYDLDGSTTALMYLNPVPQRKFELSRSVRSFFICSFLILREIFRGSINMRANGIFFLVRSQLYVWLDKEYLPNDTIK